MDFDKCFNCGDTGHLARSCPQAIAGPEPAAGKPAWCGECDKTTRLIEGRRHGRHAAWRCVKCHPLGWKNLAQHKTCGACGKQTYEYDNMPCGRHQLLDELI